MPFLDFNWADLIPNILSLLVIMMVALPFHEFAHAWSAVELGDDTPRLNGRLTLNPLAHLDPVGSLMMTLSHLAGRGMGWAKPVIINPYNFRNPRLGMVLVSAAGPFANFILALVAAIPFRLGLVSNQYMEAGVMGVVQTALFSFIGTNLSLALFNLIPIGPLDGAKILRGLAPADWDRWLIPMEQMGSMLLLALVFLGGSVLSAIMTPPFMFLLTAITGI